MAAQMRREMRPPSGNKSVSSAAADVVDDEDLEEILMELETLERQLSKATSMLDVAISPLLETYLKEVANGGPTLLPWIKLKLLFKVKLEKVIFEFNESSPISETPQRPNSFYAAKSRVFSRLDESIVAPLTVQRVAELITYPRRHYRRTDKFMRALEKTVVGFSPVEQKKPPPKVSKSIKPSCTCCSGVNESLPAQAPSSTGFVQSSRQSKTPAIDSDTIPEAKDDKPSSPCNSDKNEENDVDIQELGSKKPDSCGSRGFQEGVVIKTSETNSKSEDETDQHTTLKRVQPSTSKADASFDNSVPKLPPEKGSALSSSVVSKDPNEGCGKTVKPGIKDDECSEVSFESNDSQQDTENSEVEKMDADN